MIFHYFIQKKIGRVTEREEGEGTLFEANGMSGFSYR
jgi:hypothetical protein